jgi:hypothetical protein
MQHTNFLFFIEKHKYFYFSDYINSIIQYFAHNQIILYDTYNIERYTSENINGKYIYIFIQKIPNFLNKSMLFNKKYYVLNTEQYSYTKINHTIANLIDYSKENIIYAKKYLNAKNIINFPYAINNKEILNYKKIYDVCIVCTMSERRLQIINEMKKLGIKVTVLTNLFDSQRDEILMKHKILINIHNSEEYKIYESMRCDRCIFNKMIVISEASFCSRANKLKKFIIFRKYNFIAETTKKILDNYDYYYKLIFKNFDNFIIKYNEKLYKIYQNNIKNIENIVKLKNITQQKQKNKFGFIIIRNVINDESNLYWQECYICIRKLYNYDIIIIDDNSDKKYLNSNLILRNCKILSSKYKKRGEILGYYYLYKYKLFEKALIIHDSVFMQKKICFEKYDNISMWSFKDHTWDDDKIILKIIKKFKNTNIVNLYETKAWVGCFGIMAIVNYDFLVRINAKYNFFDIIMNNILNRDDRMALERVFGCILFIENKNTSALFGDIHDYCEWGITYEDYKNNNIDLELPIIKIWTGR